MSIFDIHFPFLHESDGLTIGDVRGRGFTLLMLNQANKSLINTWLKPVLIFHPIKAL